MDIEKDSNREAFVAWFNSLNQNGRTTYFLGQESTVAWEAWQEAKAHEAEKMKGYVLVPVEPTDAMLIAADNCVINGKVTANNIYKAMLEAARGQKK